MTRSIFDPTGGETEHSGSRNLGPDASEISHMPPDITDGVVDADEEDDATIVDAPQEPDVIDDPSALLEGQENGDTESGQGMSE
jgi:hypothetical protein